MMKILHQNITTWGQLHIIHTCISMTPTRAKGHASVMWTSWKNTCLLGTPSEHEKRFSSNISQESCSCILKFKAAVKRNESHQHTDKSSLTIKLIVINAFKNYCIYFLLNELIGDMTIFTLTTYAYHQTYKLTASMTACYCVRVCASLCL